MRIVSTAAQNMFTKRKCSSNLFQQKFLHDAPQQVPALHLLRMLLDEQIELITVTSSSSRSFLNPPALDIETTPTT